MCGNDNNTKHLRLIEIVTERTYLMSEILYDGLVMRLHFYFFSEFVIDGKF